MRCSGVNCSKQGNLSCSRVWGNPYSGNDAHLLFCQYCFSIVYRFYSHYKTLESEIPQGWYSYTVSRGAFVSSTDMELCQIAEKLTQILKSRLMFQSLIHVPAGRSSGHDHWVRKLQALRYMLHEELDERTWTLVTTRRQRKRRSHKQDEIRSLYNHAF